MASTQEMQRRAKARKAFDKHLKTIAPIAASFGMIGVAIVANNQCVLAFQTTPDLGMAGKIDVHKCAQVMALMTDVDDCAIALNNMQTTATAAVTLLQHLKLVKPGGFYAIRVNSNGCNTVCGLTANSIGEVEWRALQADAELYRREAHDVSGYTRTVNGRVQVVKPHRRGE